MDELEWSVKLYQVREVWYNESYDLPAMGFGTGHVKEVRLVGVYSSPEKAKAAGREVDSRLNKMLKDKGIVAKRRIAKKHGVEVGQDDMVLCRTAIETFQVKKDEIIFLRGQAHWNIPPESRGAPGDDATMMLDSEDRGLYWDYSAGTRFKDERARIR